MADHVAWFEVCVAGLLDHADRSAGQRLADLERRDIARGIDHAPAHVRINRHPQVADQQLAVGGVVKHGFDKLEIVFGRKAARAALQADFIRGDAHICSPFGNIARTRRAIVLSV